MALPFANLPFFSWGVRVHQKYTGNLIILRVVTYKDSQRQEAGDTFLLGVRVVAMARSVWLVSDMGLQWKRHLGRTCAAGTATALLALTPFAGLDRAQAAGLTSHPGNQTYSAATGETGAVPRDMLPDTIDDSIPEEATMVSKSVAVTDQGEARDITTGQPVTDTAVVGTPDHPADPLAKTGGKSFIPVPVSEVKEQLDESDRAGSVNPAAQRQVGDRYSSAARSGVYHPQGRSEAVAKTASLGNNAYGAHWGTYNGSQAFFEADGTLFAQQAKGVIDVSQWQGRIDWATARAAGVEGAIIRIGYGWGNGFDNTAVYNINECKRLGIPFGLYLYSYAYDSNTGGAEGDGTVDLLRRAGVQPGDLTYPVYYDLEQWVWTGHAPPTSPAVYDSIVNSWYNRLQSAGYNNLSIYSYTYYLNTALNSGTIRSRTHWVASYGTRTGFDFSANQRCWQYADNGRISGIGNNVDLNACGNRNPVDEGGDEGKLPLSDRITDITEGDYFIGSALPDRYLDIPGGSHQDETQAITWSPTNGSNQLYHIEPIGDGSYIITSKNSGKALDVPTGATHNGNAVIQYSVNRGPNQRWYFYRSPEGYVFIVSALADGRSVALDVTSGNMALGTKMEIWQYNGGRNQAFRLMQAAAIPGGKRTITSSFANGSSLDVPAGSMTRDTRLQMWPYNGGPNQGFEFIDTGNGRYQIRVVHSRMYLDLQYGFPGDRGNIVQYTPTGGSNQLWYLQKYQGGYAIRSMVNNKAIDIFACGLDPGTPVITYTFRNQVNQKWDIG